MNDPRVNVYKGDELAAYGFGHGHPFGPDRHDVFHDYLMSSGVADAVSLVPPPVLPAGALEMFHTGEYIRYVRVRCADGNGFLDQGDTPALPGLFEAACTVVGATLEAVDEVMSGAIDRAFVPIAGLHHARRDMAAGFCVFNDCGVALEWLKHRHGVRRPAYVDIDAHHGDGVFYGFESDPDVLFADIHEDGRYLYPGTGAAHETGTGPATGTKLNLPMEPGSDDASFMKVWEQVEAYLERDPPDFILLQCGADSLAGDPITHLRYSEASHAHAARRLCDLADRVCEGRVVAMGGGGYNRSNLARAWTAVVRELTRPGD